MVMCSERELEIEDLRNHPTETLMSLRDLLTTGAQAIPDPKRPGFYEVESGSRVYYIYVTPASGKVLLLATWPNESSLAEMTQAS